MQKSLLFLTIIIFGFSQDTITKNGIDYRLENISFDILTTVNNEDLHLGLAMGINNGNNFKTNVFFLARPYRKKVYVDVSEVLTDRYLENRYTVGINLDKTYYLNKDFALYSNFGLGLTYGSYSGTDNNPDTKPIFTIGLGIEPSPNFRLGYEYANLPNTNQHRLTVAFRFRFLTPIEGN